MPACNKDAFIDDIVDEPAAVQIAYIEETYDVSVHAEADGGRSHTEARHAYTLTREDLEERISKEYVTVATKFNTREDMWASRHRWLEAFGRQMHGIENPRHGQWFSRTLGVPENIGSGITKSGREITSIHNATFVFVWDANQSRWCELTGYPDITRHADRYWKKA